MKPGPPIARITETGRESWVRWTPSAPTASATSTRSLTRKRASWRRVASRSGRGQLQERRAPEVLLAELHRAEPALEALLHHLEQRPRRLRRDRSRAAA